MCLAAALVLSAGAGPLDAQAANEKAQPAPTGSQASDSQGGGPFAFGSLGKSKEPITVISDKLDYDYKANIVVYRGAVEVTQGDVKMVSDVLTLTLENKQNDQPATKPTTGTTVQDPPAPPAPAAPPSSDTGKVKEMVATGNVRIDQGTLGGGRPRDLRAGAADAVPTENPVLHDGPNIVIGERVTVYLDENRSVVEEARARRPSSINDKSNAAPAKPKAARPRRPRGRRTERARRSARRRPHQVVQRTLRGEGVCIEVRAGEVVGLLGPNGAGKRPALHDRRPPAPGQGRGVPGTVRTSRSCRVRAGAGHRVSPQEASIFRKLTV